MAQAFNGFKSDNGKTFDNEHAAWVEDLRVFLLECSAVNDGNVNGLIEHITKPRDRMRRFVGILDRIAATHPELEQDAPPLTAHCDHGIPLHTICPKCSERFAGKAPIVGRCGRRDGDDCKCDLTRPHPFCNHWREGV